MEENTLEVNGRRLPEEDSLPSAFVYKDMWVQQVPESFDVFKDFLNKIKPKRILEIGTADGGLICFLRDYLNEIGLRDSRIMTFDVEERGHYNDKLRSNNIEVNVIDIFSAPPKHTVAEEVFVPHPWSPFMAWTLNRPELVKPYIQGEGVTLVLCDGGYKIGELAVLSPLLKSGDFIMAHDYVDNQDLWEREYKDKIWNWCEVNEEQISKHCEQNNLKPYMQNKFDKVVWACRRKQ